VRPGAVGPPYVGLGVVADAEVDSLCAAAGTAAGTAVGTGAAAGAGIDAIVQGLCVEHRLCVSVLHPEGLAAVLHCQIASIEGPV
jgi:hypothetical protein